MYPEFPWDRSQFYDINHHSANKSWTSLEAQKKFLDELGKELGIKEVSVRFYHSVVSIPLRT